MASKLGWSREDHDKEAMVTENRRREQDRMMKEDEKTIASERKSELDRRNEELSYAETIATPGKRI